MALVPRTSQTNMLGSTPTEITIGCTARAGKVVAHQSRRRLKHPSTWMLCCIPGHPQQPRCARRPWPWCTARSTSLDQCSTATSCGPRRLRSAAGLLEGSASDNTSTSEECKVPSMGRAAELQPSSRSTRESLHLEIIDRMSVPFELSHQFPTRYIPDTDLSACRTAA